LNRPHELQSGQALQIVILFSAMGADDSLPDDVTTLKAMLRAERTARLAVSISLARQSISSSVLVGPQAELGQQQQNGARQLR
jgi:hypothetical protein